MKNDTKPAHRWLGLGLGLLSAITVVEIAMPMDLEAQGSGATRRERRRDTLQDTFTGWDQLGSASVSTASSEQSIQAASGADPSDRIRLRVENASLVIDHVVVTYVDGERYEAEANFAFSTSQRSHEIDLPGAPRAIQRVEFHTSNLARGQATQVEVWSR